MGEDVKGRKRKPIVTFKDVERNYNLYLDQMNKGDEQVEQVDKEWTDNKIPSRKLRKVIMEYENGDREYIEGEDAKSWESAINSAISLAFIHGDGVQDILKNIVWKKAQVQ